ncbi:MAG: phage head closure protein [Pseudomonadota bacterium]
MYFDLNRKLVLEEANQQPDGAGGFTQNWIPLGTLWAAIKPRSARLSTELDMPTSEVKMRIVVRAAPEGSTMRPKPGQRFIENTRIFAIEAVGEVAGTAKYLECWVREEAAT